jgi:hypothetical protein
VDLHQSTSLNNSSGYAAASGASHPAVSSASNNGYYNGSSRNTPTQANGNQVK